MSFLKNVVVNNLAFICIQVGVNDRDDTQMITMNYKDSPKVSKIKNYFHGIQVLAMYCFLRNNLSKKKLFQLYTDRCLYYKKKNEICVRPSH